jgi:hypothetical protein
VGGGGGGGEGPFGSSYQGAQVRIQDNNTGHALRFPESDPVFAPLWQSPAPAADTPVAFGKLYVPEGVVSGGSGGLKAYDLRTGALIWTYTGPAGAGEDFRWGVACERWGTGQRVYVLSRKSGTMFLTCLNDAGSTVTEAWRVGMGGYIPKSDITLSGSRIYFAFENPGYLQNGLAARNTVDGSEHYAFFDPSISIEPVKPAVNRFLKLLYASYRKPGGGGGVLCFREDGSLQAHNGFVAPVAPVELVVNTETLTGLVYACALREGNPSPSVLCMDGNSLALVWDALGYGLDSGGQEMAPVLWGGSGLLQFAAVAPGGTVRVAVDAETGVIVNTSPCSAVRHCYLMGCSGWLFDRSDESLTVWDPASGQVLGVTALPGEARADFYVDPIGVNVLDSAGRVVHLE